MTEQQIKAQSDFVQKKGMLNVQGKPPGAGNVLNPESKVTWPQVLEVDMPTTTGYPPEAEKMETSELTSPGKSETPP